ncbi:MAG: Peptidoglycan glycosyltransferase [Berkelbacteria bacterium GW2011_GWA1_39_10]|uniref:Peptidoglycan glycosyltransferase n=1 Tax=Berkelbacteria bacterium GW2011_GWA1_39_10 TaxID=1618332 RepID=A0A0G0LGM4_9BACT|nr:MAG: Peptidoglycan glycosyltransferase [Berkelbacteria bacterium GW2011_GWA1_39_10]
MENNNFWGKRLNFTIGFIVVIAAILGFRLFQKQVLEHATYLASAQDQYIIKKDLPAQRGKIYSSDMFPLATNRQYFQVLAVPKNIKNPDEVADKLAKILGLTKNEIFNLINNDKNYIPPLKHGLSEEEGDKIADLKLRGILVLPESRRFYPENQLASHILGFVNNSSEGQYGIEGFFDEELRGYGGEISAEKDIRGRLFSIGDKIEPTNGADYVLTIDKNIQYKAENVLQEAVKEFKADSGSITIMDPKTGAIIAMAGEPSFDPNKFSEVAKEDQDVFNNSTIVSAWEPGSVFKPLIMAAAINEGKVQPDTEGIFSNMVTVDSYEIHTSTDQAYGKETMTQVLENSDNVAMVWISEQLGKELEYKYVKDYGFGRKTAIELDTEATGDVLDVKKWSNTQRATIAFGQGISVTPIQLITAAASIANGGKLMKPYIVSEISYADGNKDYHQPQEVKRVLNTDTANKVKDMMVSVVEKGHGKKAGVSGYKVAGKTGTAQVPNPGGGYYKDRHIGSFIGFAPADDPKFIMLVRLDQPKNAEWAESSAAPTFGTMAKWLLEYFRVPPSQ